MDAVFKRLNLDDYETIKGNNRVFGLIYKEGYENKKKKISTT